MATLPCIHVNRQRSSSFSQIQLDSECLEARSHTNAIYPKLNSLYKLYHSLLNRKTQNMFTYNCYYWAETWWYIKKHVMNKGSRIIKERQRTKALKTKCKIDSENVNRFFPYHSLECKPTTFYLSITAYNVNVLQRRQVHENHHKNVFQKHYFPSLNLF